MAVQTSENEFGCRFLSELRIVLLGNRATGKTSLAKLLVGQAEPNPKRTSQCVKMNGEHAGRPVTVVDTPGWWKNFLVNETPRFQKQEMALSLVHCAPGPHAVLLLIRIDALYKEKHRKSAQQHLELLSDRVWNHTIVVFTYRNRLQEQAIVKHFGSEGESLLLWLVERCDCRYHVINVEKSTGSQVTALLEKIDAMVLVNRGCCFEMDRKWLHKVEGMMMKRYMRANRRRKMTQEQFGAWFNPGRKQDLDSTLRMILLGYRRAGKSSAGNTILGSTAFSMKRELNCVSRQGEVAGRQVTVVDTPGWWKSLSVIDTPQLDLEEIIFSVSFCPPGPHGFLLTLRVDMAFTSEEQKSVEEHMELLGKSVWAHTMLLFTHGDCLGDVTIEEFIESEGEALQWLVEKCDYKYHVFNNENRSVNSQVTSLLEKMGKMVAQNRHQAYEIQPRTVKEMNQRKKMVEKKAKARVKNPRLMREMKAMNDSGFREELSLVLLGYGDSGKSSTGNTILGRETFGSKRTERCVHRHGVVEGQKISVIDTQGWWKHMPSDQTPALSKEQVTSLVSCGPLVFVLVLRADCSFKEGERKAMEDHLTLFGRAAWDHSLVLFTFGDSLGHRSIEQHIEGEGQALQWLIERCGNRYQAFNNKAEGERHQVRELLEKIEEIIGGCEQTETAKWKRIEERRAIQEITSRTQGEDDVFMEEEEEEELLLSVQRNTSS